VEKAYACIESIRRNTPAPSYHITVIDNGSDKGPFKYWLTDKFSDLTIVHLPFNHGYCRGTNVGIALSLLTNSEYVLLLNSDTKIPDGAVLWLDRLIGTMNLQGMSIGAVGAVSNNVYGAQRRNEVGLGWNIVPALIGFCLLLRKEAILKVGLLDERFEPGNYDDWDISIRLTNAGYKLAVAESVFIHHDMHSSFKALDGTEPFNELLERNKQKLIDKWGVEELKAVGL
jgi:GT2 family glycosyltransferase